MFDTFNKTPTSITSSCILYSFVWCIIFYLNCCWIKPTAIRSYMTVLYHNVVLVYKKVKFLAHKKNLDILKTKSKIHQDLRVLHSIISLSKKRGAANFFLFLNWLRNCYVKKHVYFLKGQNKFVLRGPNIMMTKYIQLFWPPKKW